MIEMLFEYDRETTNTVRLAETATKIDGEDVIDQAVGVLYVRKDALDRLGLLENIPHLTVTIAPAGEPV